MEGIIDIQPEIKDIKFTYKGKIDIFLKDGRIIAVPLRYFPEIKKLNKAQRKKIQIIDNVGFTFLDCNEVYHIEQILGRYENYKFNL